MTTLKGSDNAFPSILFEEHVDPATPPSGHWRLFVDTDKILKLIDDAGAVTNVTGSAVTRASLGLATSDSPEFAGLNIGHATDTTLARSSAGVLTVEGNRLFAVGGTDVPVADGGTGASTASAARTNLGLVLGTDVASLTAGVVPIAQLATGTPTGSKFIRDDGTLQVPAGGGGNVAADAIWDAAGDLAVGTGADTAAKLTKGAAGTVPTAGASTLAYAFPPGYEFDYVQATAPVNITATTEGTATTIVTGSAVAYDGSTVVMIECMIPSLATTVAAANHFIQVVLYDGSSSIGGLSFQQGPGTAGAGLNVPVRAVRRLTPSNATHTYSIRAFVDAGTGVATGGAGGNGNFMPMFIRITKV